MIAAGFVDEVRALRRGSGGAAGAGQRRLSRDRRLRRRGAATLDDALGGHRAGHAALRQAPAAPGSAPRRAASADDAGRRARAAGRRSARICARRRGASGDDQDGEASRVANPGPGHGRASTVQSHARSGLARPRCARIDRIDDQLSGCSTGARAWSLRRRAKSASAGRVYVPEREKRIFRGSRAAERRPAASAPARPRDLREIISACLALEQRLRIAYLGPEATFSHRRRAEHSASRRATCRQRTVERRVRRGGRGRADLGVVPVENSTEGVVAQTLDLLHGLAAHASAPRSRSRSSHCLLARPAPRSRACEGRLAPAGAGAVPARGWPSTVPTCRAHRGGEQRARRRGWRRDDPGTGGGGVGAGGGSATISRVAGARDRGPGPQRDPLPRRSARERGEAERATTRPR